MIEDLLMKISIGALAIPGTLLVKKVSDAVGGITKPYQIVRVAKAEAKVERIKTESEIQISDLRLRTARRSIKEEMRKQSNMENITAKAIPHLNPDSSPDKMENDWITNFFDKSRIVSDSDMQDLWAGILAGEANMPGTFSRKTVNLMADLEKRDAEMFRNLCRFAWKARDSTLIPVVFDLDHEIYKRHGIAFDSANHLQAIGLANLNPTPSFGLTFSATEEKRLSYQGKNY